MNEQALVENIVFEKDGRLITTSRRIAKFFGKNHADVLRAIRNLEHPKEFVLSNFAECSYVNESNRDMPEYHITETGCHILIGKFTGKKAAYYQALIANEFQRLRDENKMLKAGYQVMDLEESLTLNLSLVRKNKAMALENHKLGVEVKELKSFNQVILPKATMYDRVLNDDKLLKIGDVAKLFNRKGIGRNNMFKELRERKILFGREPYQQYINRGYFEVKLTTYTHPKTGELVTDKITLVTKKGFDYLAKLFNINVPENEIMKYVNR